MTIFILLLPLFWNNNYFVIKSKKPAIDFLGLFPFHLTSGFLTQSGMIFFLLIQGPHMQGCFANSSLKSFSCSAMSIHLNSTTLLYINVPLIIQLKFHLLIHFFSFFNTRRKFGFEKNFDCRFSTNL